ncbi:MULTISPECIES: hypothetical protein [unclassified Gordonia (in: high G+C Gram-positive bacteria)]
MTTSGPRVLSLPTFPNAKSVGTDSALADPTLADPTVDAVEFQRGYDDAASYLASMPRAWATHHAATALSDGRIPDIKQSYERGYRAALYGFRRQSRH